MYPFIATKRMTTPCLTRDDPGEDDDEDGEEPCSGR
jgi:hypothetical protein